MSGNKQQRQWWNRLGRRQRGPGQNATPRWKNAVIERLEDRVLLAVDFVGGPLKTPSLNRPDRALGIGSDNTQPMIAVSPADPGNLSIANERIAMVSTDAGASFSPALDYDSLLDGSLEASGLSDLAYDGHGQLFWSNLVQGPENLHTVGVARLDAVTGQPQAGPEFVPRPVSADYAKPFIAADVNSQGTSLHAGNLYTVFTDQAGTDQVLLSRSTDGGANWSNPIEVSALSETNAGVLPPVTPADVAVAPNGDVYVAYHYQPGVTPPSGADSQSNSDGISGRILVLRSADGGRSFASKSTAFAPGQADMNLNIQSLPDAIPGIRFWGQGARQPWIMADPVREGHVYVIANDDPDNAHGVGDDGDVVFARSTDYGQTWHTSRVGSNSALQIMPTAAIDEFGNIVVAWYDTRRGLLQGTDARLDVFATYSTDGGITWAEEFRVTDDDNPIDPVTSNTFIVYPGADLDGNPNSAIDGDETYSLGQYFGVEVFGGTAYIAWNGNTSAIGLPVGHQVYLDVFPINGTLHVSGTDADDSIVVQALPDNPEFVQILVNGQRQYAGLIEALSGGILIDGQPGNDTLTVDFRNGDPVPSAGVFFEGNIPEGGDGEGDTLNILANAATLEFQAEEFDQDAGLFLVGDSAQISFDSIEMLQSDGQQFLQPDNSEPNDSLAAATVLGSEPAVTLQERTVHDVGEGDSNPDFYQVTASHTGKLIVNALFNHAKGNLDLEVLDIRGNSIAVSSSQTDNEQIVIPVVTQQVYFVRVFGVDGAINTYDLEIENFAAPVPGAVQLSPNSDTGMMNNDGITADSTPRLVVQADLSDFRQMGIRVLTAEEAAEGQTAGAAVLVSIAGETTGETTTGFASLLEDGDDLYEFRASELLDETYLVSAAVQIFDPRLMTVPDDVQPDPAVGRSQLSDPLRLTIDTQRPELTSPQLLPSSDSGMSQQDAVTNVTQPAFVGIAEPNAKVRVLANGLLVGQGVAGSDARWEITTEPLRDGIYFFTTQAEDLAGNFSENSNQVVAEIDTLAPNTPFLDLTSQSDTGADRRDEITRQDTLTFNMTTSDPNDDDHLIPQNLKFRLFLRPENGSEQLIYDSSTDETIPLENLQDGLTDLDFLQRTFGPLPDGVHNFKLEVEDRAGNISDDYLLTVEIDTAIEQATIDLIPSSDTGMSADDNVTGKDAPALAGVGDVGARVSLFANGVLVGTGVVGSDETDFVPGDGLGAWEITSEPLDDGTYQFVAHLEDTAGNFLRTEPLAVEIDTLAPNTPYLDLVSLDDTGERSDDNITALNELTFTMTTQDPNQAAHVSPFNYKYRLFLRPEGGPETLVYQSLTDATIPPENLQGGFTDLEFLQTTLSELPDGIHNFKLEVEDRAGNISDDFLLTVEINPMNSMGDTEAPRIVNVTRNDEPFTSLFDPKPSGGPDPLIRSIVVHFADGPERTDDVQYEAVIPALAREEGNYRLAGDANGNIPITNVNILSSNTGPGEATMAVELVFAAPLPDDRFTLTVFDRITDPPGNPLDGESGALAPFEGNDANNATPPVLPTGDGNPGEDFHARFTVDSRPELAVWAAGSIWVDTNGNFEFDPANRDYVNRDIIYRMGFTSDDIFAGNFSAGNGTDGPTEPTPDAAERTLPTNGQEADGYDKLAAYGRVEGQFRWLVDFDNDGVADIDSIDPANVNGLPVAGRFDGSDANGDEVGVYTGRTWYFDTNHDFKVDLRLDSELRGYPIIGDFDGDGFDDLATWTDDEFQIDLAFGVRNGWDGWADTTFRFGFIGVRERPVAADMDQDGFDDLGLWTPDREGVTARAASEWYWLISGGNSLIARVAEAPDPVRGQPQVPFTPVPFGHDLFAQFGDDFALPVVGNFDPPVLPSLTVVEGTDPIQTNPDNPLDVNADGFVSPLDALLVINQINGPTGLTNSSNEAVTYFDVSGDGSVSPIDALTVINYLNGLTVTEDVEEAEPLLIGFATSSEPASGVSVNRTDEPAIEDRRLAEPPVVFVLDPAIFSLSNLDVEETISLIAADVAEADAEGDWDITSIATAL